MLWHLLFLFSFVHPNDHVVLMGDSEAYLLGWEFPEIAKKHGVEFDTVAIPGSSVIQWATKLHKEWYKIRKLKPTTIFVSLGANDACIGSRVVRNEKPYLEKFLKRLERTGATKVFWLGPPKIGVPKSGKSLHPQAISGLDDFANMVSEQTIYLDARDVDIDMWDDQLHCSRPRYPGQQTLGCKTWANWVWDNVFRYNRYSTINGWNFYVEW
jgi:hypothetical protein